MDSPLDDALDQLYAGPPESFVARRGTLAAELAGQGLKSEAAEIKQRRRPSAAAGAVNAVVRSHRDEVHALGVAADQLQSAQADALAGRGAGDLRAATRARKGIVDQLTDAAVALLAETSPQAESYRAAIANTFEAATIDPDARALVESGALVKELALPTGLGSGFPSAATSVVPLKLAKPRAAKPGRATDPREEARAARARAAEAKAVLAEARRAQKETQRIADRDDAAAMHARATADEAVRAVTDLEEQLAAARRADREARTAARLADQTARASATTAARATERLDALESADD